MKTKMRPAMKRRWALIQFKIAYSKMLEKSRIFDLYFVDSSLQRYLKGKA